MLSVPVDDRGYTLGHGLFETILCVDGELVWWDDHLARLKHGCAMLRLPAPEPADCLAAARAAWVDAGRPGRAAVRLNWTAGSGGRGLDLPEPLTPRLTASAAPSPRPATPITLATAQVRRNDRSPASRLKTLAYLDNVLARAEARDAGADEALMLNTSEEVACASAGNVFWLADGELITPALDCGVLDGLARRRVILAASRLGLPVREISAPLDALGGRALFVTNCLVGVRSVARLDGLESPPDPAIEILARALDLPA
jgi:branched-subunit amino acid aminotransferase/4-amino-4-deoxychorismate lyase